MKVTQSCPNLCDSIDCISTVQFSSVTQLCPSICNPMLCSTPGLRVHHQILEFTQTHIHQVSDAIQPSHPLSSPCPLTFNLSRIRVFSNELVLLIRWTKYWSFSFSISPSNEFPLGLTGLISFSPRDSQESFFYSTTVQKHPFFAAQLSL